MPDFTFDIEEKEGRFVCTRVVDDYAFIKDHYPMHIWWEQLRREMSTEIYRRVAAMGTWTVVKIEEKYMPDWDGTRAPSHRFVVEAEIRATRSADIMMPTLTPIPYPFHVKDSEACQYCGSYAPDDDRGNCRACGGTR